MGCFENTSSQSQRERRGLSFLPSFVILRDSIRKTRNLLAFGSSNLFAYTGNLAAQNVYGSLRECKRVL